MSSTHRNRKNGRAGHSGTREESQAADRYIDRVLRQDRARLSAKHDRERSRTRAMGLLAASAMPAAEGSAASWFSRLIGVKGLTGILSIVAVVGGAVVGTLMLTDAFQGRDAAPVPAAARASGDPTAPTKVPSTQQEPVSAEENEAAATYPAEPQGIATRKKHGDSGAAVHSESWHATTTNVEPQPANAVASEAQPPTEPEVRRRNSARTTVSVDPVIVRSK